jgi:Ca2+-binding EF-hand superfamily protein
VPLLAPPTVVFTDPQRRTIQITYAGLSASAAAHNHGSHSSSSTPTKKAALSRTNDEEEEEENECLLWSGNVHHSHNNDDENDDDEPRQRPHHHNTQQQKMALDDVIKVGWIAHELLTGIHNPMDESGLEQSTLLSKSALRFIRDLLQQNGPCTVQMAQNHDWFQMTTAPSSSARTKNGLVVNGQRRLPPPPTTAAPAKSKTKGSSKPIKDAKKPSWSVPFVPSTPPPPHQESAKWWTTNTTPATAAMTPDSSCGGTATSTTTDRGQFVPSPISIVDHNNDTNDNIDMQDVYDPIVVPEEFLELRQAYDDLKSSKAHTTDNVVTAQDLKTILRERKTYTEEEVETWFRGAHLWEDSNSRQVKFTALLHEAIRSRRRVERARVVEAFMSIDKDRQGFVTVGNLRAILGTKHVLSDHMETIIKEAADQRRDGRIRYHEFQDVLQRWNEQETAESDVGRPAVDESLS